MWEIWTSGIAYADVPEALLGYRVAVENIRPRFPISVPRDYAMLAERCWDPSATDRYTEERGACMMRV